MARKATPVTDGEEEKKALPAVNKETKEIPAVTDADIELPVVSNTQKPLPPILNPDNVVHIGDIDIEIKPTKLKYQRDRTAIFYRVLDIYPLPDILAMEEGVLDPDRDGDKCLFDWLIAVFDDPKTVVKYYDQMDSEVINRCLSIFKRLNGIDEKEEKAKNRLTKETKR